MHSAPSLVDSWRPLKAGACRYGLALLGLQIIALLHLNISLDHWTLTVPEGDSFAALQFHLASLPRLVMTLLVGAALGLSGSLLQQLTQNRLVSPMTLGAASGAWLGLLAASLVLPIFAAEYGHWAALAGALLSVGLVLLIAGRDGIAGLPVILAGMAMNLLLGALAIAVLILNQQQTRGLFIWGAGDMGQIDWSWVHWLWPKLLPGLLLLWLAPRVLTLLKLGGTAARGRGLNLWPALLMLFLASLWMTAAAITAVGLIGFIGLVAPNLARLCGARTARDELVYSVLLGMLVLLASDAVALLLSHWLSEQIPTGAVAALIGAPALLWLACRQGAAQDRQALALPRGRDSCKVRTWWLLTLATVLTALFGLCLQYAPQGWQLAWPADVLWSLRWPRLLSAAAAGTGLAVAGVLLQRLLHNPLASPDILGLSAGAALAVMISLLLFGQALFWLLAPIAAFIGCLLVLATLLLLGRKQKYSPALMVLVGMALAALLNTALQLALSQGSSDSLALLGWLAGSTYRVSGLQAIALGSGVSLLIGLSLFWQRALDLLSAGDGIAHGRGLDVPATRLVLLLLVSLLCALVTSLVGPVSFLGLLAPHMAVTLGARRIQQQLPLAALLGCLLMLLADLIGRNLIFPLQIPLGIVASILCGSYFIFLLLRRRLA
ncbi:Fe3+-hydroxamate ABC transporter permease FhuB [Ectopseudomonas alcaliphila JAB1]|nr:Fe(3+)-hydroxamate ABC transporter permease FhuB [Pseudomonas alcaliphila]APU32868.1 Fe3+-hydroxamate ABC transporter permease FhuB [Pseudomonas alcaliphila JAB1]